MSNKNPVITTSILETLPKNPRHRSVVLKALERKAVRLGLLMFIVGFVALGAIELSGQSPEERGNLAAEDLFQKTNGTICTGQQQHTIENEASQAFINRLTELCAKAKSHSNISK